MRSVRSTPAAKLSSTRVSKPMAEPTRLPLDISKSLIFVLVFVTMAVLVGLGKIEAEKLQYLLLILVPSPIRTDLSDKKVE